MVNEWKYGEWQFGFLDDSITIAFNPNELALHFSVVLVHRK